MDLSIVEWFQSIRNGFLDGVFSFITEFGGDLVFLVAGTLLWWLYDKRFGYRFMTIFLFTLGINDIIKNIIARERPYTQDGITSIGEETYGYAMPSAHSSNAGIMALLIHERFGKIKKWITPTVFIMALLVGISRVYLGQHYLSDVIAGFALAAAVYYGIVYLKPKISLPPFTIVYIGLAIFFIALFFVLDRNLYIAFGSILGLTIGHQIELKYVDYKEKAPWPTQIIKYLIGLIVALILQEGLKIVLPYGNTGELGTLILDSVRYFILTLWLSLGALATFKTIFKTT